VPFARDIRAMSLMMVQNQQENDIATTEQA